jgi:nucleotide-binding universal stress UspA family protein
MKTFTFLVPVDFSECSYNALQYATMLARRSNGEIFLFHVIDLEEMPDSENPVVINFAMERLIKKAQDRIRSLKELISLKQVVVKQQIAIGNVTVELTKQISEVKPDVIVMGRNADRKVTVHSLLKHITSGTNVPVLVVPQAHNPRIPNRAVLASDFNPKKDLKLAPLFDIIKKVTNELSVLDIKSNYFSNAQDALTWIKNLNETYGVDAKLLRQESRNGFLGIRDLLQVNEVDLICTVDHNRSFLDRLLGRNTSATLTNQLEVPVLVIKE